MLANNFTNKYVEGSGLGGGRVSFNSDALDGYIDYFSSVETKFNESKEAIDKAIAVCQTDEVWSGDTRADADVQFLLIKQNLDDMMNNLHDIKSLLNHQLENFRKIKY